MASVASEARRSQRAVEGIASVAERLGGPRAENRLRLAHKRSRRKGSAAFLEELEQVLKEAESGMVPDTTPLKGNLKGLHPHVLDLLASKKGIKTKADLRMSTDAELLSIPGIGPGTLHRLRKNLETRKRSSS